MAMASLKSIARDEYPALLGKIWESDATGCGITLPSMKNHAHKNIPHRKSIVPIWIDFKSLPFTYMLFLCFNSKYLRISIPNLP